jgi:hypothetical protein
LFALLLRIAESLDRSHQSSVKHAHFCLAEGKAASGVTLEVLATQEGQLELWGVQTHRQAFEKVFGKRLEIRWIVVEGER